MLIEKGQWSCILPKGRKGAGENAQNPKALEPKKKPAGNQRVTKDANGAGDEIRTHDIHLGKVALYH